MPRCCKAWVTGKVQGVGFRLATQEQALLRGVTGYAKNLPDGRVEVLMCGAADSLDEISEWLWQGPDGASVSHVELGPLENCCAPTHFTTG